MTQKQLDSFNLKVNILYDHERGICGTELQKKYNLSQQMVSVYLKLAKNNYLVRKSVEIREKNNEIKDQKDHK